MNVIFISPHFPYYYYNFCDRLKKRGVNVLGIGDTPYDMISNETKESVNEYYYVSSLENYDEVFKAVAFYSYKYGKIDWIESENEYWLELEAKLRTDFNVKTGPQEEDMPSIRYKSKMKDVYRNAGIPIANYTLLDSLETGLTFAQNNGYPLIVKPDNGMGASDTHKLNNDDDFKEFWKNKIENITYICEVCIPGRVETFEGITDSSCNILIASSHVMVNQVMDNVNENKDTLFYSQSLKDKDIEYIGENAVRSFNAKNRFFHFEFMRLEEDKEGLGKKGDVIGLEVNMRAPGAYIPDMMNLTYDVDVYDIWAEMLVSDLCKEDIERKYFVEYAGRRKGKKYAFTTKEIYERHKDAICQEEYVPEALAEAMGEHIFIYRAKTEEEMHKIRDDILLPYNKREALLAKEAQKRAEENLKKAQSEMEEAIKNAQKFK